MSLTITKIGSDTERNDIEIVCAISNITVSQEVFQLKLASGHTICICKVCRTLFPNNSKVLIAFITIFLLKRGSTMEFRISSLFLFLGQDFVTMCRYILKDEGQPWFQHRSFNVPREDW